MDVAKPGSTPADATSRPLIVTKGAMIKDPMVQSEAPESPADPTITPPSVSKKTIAPLVSQEKDVSEAQLPTQATPTKPDTEFESSVFDQETTEIDPTDDTAETKEQAALEKQQAAADELIKQKKYFVPIGIVTRRKAGRHLAVLLSLCTVIAVAGLAAIDAGILASNIALPFDFIK